MRFPFPDPRIAVAYLSVGSLAVLTFLAYFQFWEYRTYTKWVGHTYEVLNTAQQLESHLSSELALRREFVFSLDATTKARALEHRTAVFRLMDSLRTMTADNFSQAKNLDRLSVLLSAPSLPMNKWDNYPTDGSLTEKMKSDILASRHTVDSIYGQLQRMEAIEHDYFNVRSAYQQESGNSIPILFLVSGIGSLFLLVYAFYQTNQELKTRLQAQQALEQNVAQLHATNLELERFAYLASHHLKEPLRKALTFLSRIQRHDSLSENEHSLLGKAQQNLLGSQRLLDDLNQYAALVRYEGTPENTDLNRVFRVCCTKMEAALKSSGAQIRVAKLPNVSAHPRLLELVFEHLLSNAIKYAKPGQHPEIEVSAEQDKAAKQWVVTFADRGIGFDVAYRERIFEVFEQLRPKHDYDGTGIGLAICRRAMSHHNGSIHAEAEPGAGARFILTFPD